MSQRKSLHQVILLALFFLMFSGKCFGQDKNTLDFYLTTAEKNSPLLNDYNNRIFSSKIDSLKQRADYGFKVNGIADASYSPQFNGWGYDGNSTINGNNLALLGRVSRDFLGKDNFNTRLQNFSLGIQQILNQKKLSILNLKRAITEQYILAYTSQEQFDIDKEIIHILDQEDLILKKLTQASVFKQTDYLTFKVMHQQSLLNQKQHEADWQNNYAALQYLSGLVSTNFKKLSAPYIENTGDLDFTKTVYADSFKTDSLKLANDIKIINYDYKPKVSAFADGGYSSALINTPYKNFGVSVGLSLTVPIYDGHQRKMLIEQKLIETDTKTKYLKYTENQYLQQINLIHNQIQQYQELLKIARTQMKYSQTLIEANLKQLPTGDVRMVDFILSITNYTTLKTGILQYENNLLRLQNNLSNLIVQ